MNLHFETVTPELKEVLIEVMKNPLFEPFRLVGGTSLSLRLGHRKSVDIDLFTSAPYGSLDFSTYERFFQEHYPYFDYFKGVDIIGFSRSYYVGNSVNDSVKVDMFYHDEMIDPCEILNGIRIASLEDVTAMKVDVISRNGRKKDFWDIHELLDHYSISDMLSLHKQRHEYTHDREQILSQFQNFTTADEDIDPICLKGKIWELIKLDITEILKGG